MARSIAMVNIHSINFNQDMVDAILSEVRDHQFVTKRVAETLEKRTHNGRLFSAGYIAQCIAALKADGVFKDVPAPKGEGNTKPLTVVTTHPVLVNYLNRKSARKAQRQEEKNAPAPGITYEVNGRPYTDKAVAFGVLEGLKDQGIKAELKIFEVKTEKRFFLNVPSLISILQKCPQDHRVNYATREELLATLERVVSQHINTCEVPVKREQI